MDKSIIERINKFAEGLENKIVETENDIWENDYDDENLRLAKFKKELYELVLVELESLFEDILYP